MKLLSTGLQCLGLVFVGTLLGGFLGLGVAHGLARAFPGYYPGVFPHAAQAGIDPAEVGEGLGFSQGMILGTVVSVLVVAVLTWASHRTRLERTVEALAEQIEDLQTRLDPATATRLGHSATGRSEHIRSGPGTPQP